MRSLKQALIVLLSVGLGLMSQLGCYRDWVDPASLVVAPTVSTQPANQTVLEGATATFTVTATGTAPLSYQWKKGATNVGSNSPSYTTPVTVLGDSGTQFSVVVTDTAGSTTSSAATLTVNPVGGGTTQLLLNPGFELGNNGAWVQSNTFIITNDPGSQPHAGSFYGWIGNYTNPTTDSLYQQVAIPANASSTSLNFWLKIVNNASPPGTATNILSVKVRNSSGSDLVTLATFSNLNVGASYVQRGPYDLSAYAGQTLQVFLSSFQPGTFGTSFLVDDFELNATTVSATAPVITTQPQGLSITQGQTATFTVVASGTPLLAYQWRKGGTNIGGANAATYTINNAQVSDSGSFDVVVSNGSGSATSNPATLTVNSSSTPPTITSQPSSQTATAGQSVSFTVAATGSAPLAYQWRRNGSNIGGATNATLTFTATMADNGVQYSVVVSNGSGSATSANATLTVNPKSRDLNGDGQTNVLDLATFMAAYSGSGIPTSNPAADLDGDGDCDDVDLALLLAGI